MISIDLIRRQPELVLEAGHRRGEEIPVERILELDVQRRAAIAERDNLRAFRNRVSRELGQAKERPPELIQQMRDTGARIRELDEAVRAADGDMEGLLAQVPNIPRDDVPQGADESENVPVRTVGELPEFDFEPAPHWELGERLGIIDFQRGVKLARSRFFVLQGKGARLQRALISWMLDMHTSEHGYHEVYPPYLVNSESVVGSGHLPKFADTMYHDTEDDLWLVPTAEVPITNLHRDEILAHDALPLDYVAHSPSFRRERAAAGRDTRGIKRVHQFEKVEMFKFVEPEESDAALENMLADAETVCARLEVPYRIVELCTGDLGFAAVKTYDLEMWAAGCQEWLEVSSCSNCTDFQARRASIRYRPQPGAAPRFVHTLNGSGLAIPRTLIAILENYQQPDGSVTIPQVLRPYTGFDRIEAE